MPTQEIGQGLRMLKVDGAKELLDQVKDVYGLADLQAKLRKAPYELSQAQSEAAIKANEATLQNLAAKNVLSRAQAIEAAHRARPDVLAMEDALKHAELVTKVGTEQRAQSDFLMKGMESLPTAFGHSLELGQEYLKTLIPNARAVKNEDGTFSIGIPQADGAYRVVTVDPNKVAGPEKVQKLESDMREGWRKTGEGFATVDEFYKNFKGTINDPVTSGPGDIAALFSYMKMLDRNTAVREGQFAEAKDAPNVSQSILNLYNRAVSTQGPVLGDVDSPTRQGFNRAADTVYNIARDRAVRDARFYGNVAKNGGGNPENVVIPFGGIDYKSLYGTDPGTQSVTSAGKAPGMGREAEKVPAGLPAPQPARPKPGEASMLPSSEAKPAPAGTDGSPAPARVEDTLKNLFTLPEGQ
jgi:hypothetical protein